MSDKTTGDEFVSLTVTEGVSSVPMTRIGEMPWMEAGGSAAAGKANGISGHFDEISAHILPHITERCTSYASEQVSKDGDFQKLQNSIYSVS